MLRSGFLNKRRHPKFRTTKVTVVHASPTSSSEQKIEISSIVFGKLPSELIYEILTRLPAKSLCRFKCVSKLWKSIVSDHRFVATHHRVSATRREGVSVLLNIGVGKKSRQAMYALNPDLVHQLTLPIDNIVFVSESVHGLISLSDSARVVTVCNPSTRSFFTLPRPFVSGRTTCKLEDIDVFYLGLLNVTSLGYDSVTGQHKLLNTRVGVGKQSDHSATVHKIFVLGGSSTEWSWRVIHGPNYIKRDLSVFVGGFIYYRACAGINNNIPEHDEVLMEFDVHCETFRIVKLPKSALNLLPPVSFVIRLEGRLVVMSYENILGKRSSVDIWTLVDQVKLKWVHKTIVFASSDETKFLKKCSAVWAGTLSNGELVFARSAKKPCYLFCFNLKTATVRIVEVSSLSTPFISTTLTNHVENLLMLKKC